MFVIIDETEKNFRAIRRVLQLKSVPVKLLWEPDAIRRYIKSSFQEEHSFLIHGSAGTSMEESERGAVSDYVKAIVEKLHDVNPFARVTIFSNSSRFPLRDYITELRIDGFINDIMPWDRLLEIARRGNVTAEELRLRGITAKNFIIGRRVTGESAFRHYREREILD